MIRQLTNALRKVFCRPLPKSGAAFPIYFSPNLSASDRCETILLPSSRSTTISNYLKFLMDEKILTINEVEEFKAKLEDGVVGSPFLERDTSSNRLIHSELFERLQTNISPQDIVDLIQQIETLLTENDAQEVSRIDTEAKTQQDNHFIQFKPLLSNQDYQVQIADAPISQYQWKKIMGTNGAQSANRLGSEILPMENIDAFSIQDFFTRINDSDNLPEIQKLLSEIIPDHKSGDIYRLPNQGEIRFLLSETAVQVGENFERFEWGPKNSSNELHRIRSKPPYLINGQEIYDIRGLVMEVFIKETPTPDTFPKSKRWDVLTLNVNPQIPPNPLYIYGIPAIHAYTNPNLNPILWDSHDIGENNLGFRIVRERRRPQ